MEVLLQRPASMQSYWRRGVVISQQCLSIPYWGRKGKLLLPG